MATPKPPTLTPPPCDGCTTTFPAPHVLLVTISRPKLMNSMTHRLNWDLDRLFAWYDAKPALRCCVVTGAGTRAFCAGSDLLEIEAERDTKRQNLGAYRAWEHVHPPSGFAGMSRRRGRKPILAAVNGLALGGGFEIVLNCDLVVASPKAQFGLPEIQVGVYAYGGGLPRLVRLVGMRVASDIALTGRRVGAEEALRLGLINAVAKSPESVLEETLEKAKQIAAMSPDGVVVTRAALREAWETASVERAFQITHDQFYEPLMKSENSAEGLAAFREKRKPNWKDAKL